MCENRAKPYLGGAISEPQMTTIAFDPDACDRNPYCPVTRACPTGAMYIDKRTFSPAFDASKCTGCGTCLASCPHGAVREI